MELFPYLHCLVLLFFKVFFQNQALTSKVPSGAPGRGAERSVGRGPARLRLCPGPGQSRGQRAEPPAHSPGGGGAWGKGPWPAPPRAARRDRPAGKGRGGDWWTWQGHLCTHPNLHGSPPCALDRVAPPLTWLAWCRGKRQRMILLLPAPRREGDCGGVAAVHVSRRAPETREKVEDDFRASRETVLQ